MEVVKYIAAFICGAYTSGLIANSIEDSLVKALDESILSVFVAIGLIFGMTYVYYSLFDYISKGVKNGVETVKEHNENKRETEEYLSEMRRSERQYISAKNSYRYFSDDKIREQLGLSESSFNPVERLALEETAVERGIIDHSPMHEKGSSLLRAINKTANDL